MPSRELQETSRAVEGGTAATIMVAVIVPDGVASGDYMHITVADREFDVCVPPGVRTGETIEVDVDVDGPHEEPDPSARAMRVLVPEGVAAGELFTVVSEGLEFHVPLPENCCAGDQIEVRLPSPEELGAVDEVEVSEETGYLSESQRFDMHMQETLRDGEDASGATGSNSQIGSSAFRVGEDVMVQRSNGDYTPARIIEYDDISETYTVILTLDSRSHRHNPTRHPVPSPTLQKVHVCCWHFFGELQHKPSCHKHSYTGVLTLVFHACPPCHSLSGRAPLGCTEVLRGGELRSDCCAHCAGGGDAFRREACDGAPPRHADRRAWEARDERPRVRGDSCV